MLNNPEYIINTLMSDKTIAETMGKIISGQYVTDRERKEGLKALIDRWAELSQINVSEQEKVNIKLQAFAMKQVIDTYKEVNF